MRGPSARLRAMALLSVAAYAVHELRYLAGYGREASQAMADQGHAYLGVVGPLVGVLLALTLGWFLAGLVRAPDGGRTARLTSLRARWVAASAALISIYVVQELLEGALAAGHPVGLAGVVGAGGWSAAVFAVAIGMLVALLLRGADAALAWATSRRAPRARLRTSALRVLPAALRAPSSAQPAGPLGARAPPLAS